MISSMHMLGTSDADGWAMVGVFAALALGLLALAAVSGFVAWKIGRRWEALVLGMWACSGVASFTGRALGMPWPLALLAGVVGSAAAGAVVAAARNRGSGGARVGAAVAILAVLLGLSAVAGLADGDDVPASESATEDAAEQLGQKLDASPAETADELTEVAMGLDYEVVEASGERCCGSGAELTIRVTSPGDADVRQCWDYRLTHTPVHPPAAVDCPGDGG